MNANVKPNSVEASEILSFRMAKSHRKKGLKQYFQNFFSLFLKLHFL